MSQNHLNPSIRICLSLVVALTSAPLLGHAQLGVSPSQNAAFLTELRARDPKRAEENRDVLGDDREKLEAGRALSRPDLFNPSLASPQRLAADITGFPSQYQLGRSYLSPWYDGVAAPETSIESAAGLKAGFAFEQGFEYNSGVNGGKGGVILSSTLLFDGSYKLAENQRLTFSGGLGFNWVSGNDHIDWNYFSDEFGLAVLPGTSIAYDAQFGPVSLTLYDRVSVRPYLGVLQNDLGIAGTWQITQDLSWTLNYTHSTTHDVDGSYFGGMVVDADLDTFSSLVNYEINPSLSVGLEGALSWINHDDGTDANDGKLWSAGVYAAWKLNATSRLRVAAGYQNLKFENTRSEFIGGFFPILPDETEDASEPYYSISFSQRLTEWLSHELAVGYEANLDFTANFNSSHYANYGLTAEAWKGGRVTASAFVEISDLSGYEIFGETGTGGGLNSYGLDLHASQQITSRIDASIGYSYARFEVESSKPAFVSNAFETDLNQHMAGLNLGFSLSEKVRLNLAYQAFFLNSENGPDRDNHRVILGVRVQF